MKKCISRGIALTAIAGLVLATRAQDTDQSQFPTILQQPVDQCLPVGAPATFSVVATNVDSYQWYLNNAALAGQTNSSLTVPSVGINDVGYYFASVVKGTEAVPTRSACLNVYIASASPSPLMSGSTFKSGSMSMSMSPDDLGSGGVITVFGLPVVSSGGGGSCPGPYSGYVNYVKTISQGWGWAPSTNTTTFMASDTNRVDTKVQAAGKNGDTFCGQTSITIPNPPYSPKYRFSIYFPPNTQIPTNAYAITLTGFDQ